MFVRVGDALVILLAKLVLVGVGIGIAAAPELFDEPFALLVGLQFLEGLALFVGDDVSDVFFEPVLVRLFQFGLDVARALRRILALFGRLSFLRQTGLCGKQ